jgi:hypothetical protein
VGKFCSFGFAKVRLVCRAKPNVQNVRLAKIELKKCAVGEIKNTEGSAMSVGSVAVQLKYGLYVGHLSKLAFHFYVYSCQFGRCCVVC